MKHFRRKFGVTSGPYILFKQFQVLNFKNKIDKDKFNLKKKKQRYLSTFK